MSPGYINDLVMISSSDYYWTACDYDFFFRTADSWISWTQQPSAGEMNSFLVGIDALDSDTALFVGQSAQADAFGKIIRTIDSEKNCDKVHECDTNLYKVAIEGTRCLMLP